MKNIYLFLISSALFGCISLMQVPTLGTDADVPGTGAQEALTGFDGKTNGAVDQATFEQDQVAFEDVETIADGLGPLFNAQSCRECHQSPTSGGASQVTELRAGLRDAHGRFQPPRVPIARGTVVIEGRTLINDRAICPNGAFPDQEIQEHVPDEANIRAFRLSLNLLGDGLVEAVSDEFLRNLAARQCKDTHGRICGLAIEVPVLEAPGINGIGRFGWKSQHASLLSFSADAYLNEMGITSRLQPTEVTTVCDTVADPEDTPDAQAAAVRQRQARRKLGTGKPVTAEEFADIDRFARFIRATKAPSRDATLAATDRARKGSALFDNAGCATCHVRNMVTVAAGTKINGATFTVPAALGNRLFHPFSDFLLHDVDTGDGIETAVQEHYGRGYTHMRERMISTANRLRTPPLWGVRTRSRLMHDGETLTLRDAILRHGGEARDPRTRFSRMSTEDQEALLAFLRTL